MTEVSKRYGMWLRCILLSALFAVASQDCSWAEVRPGVVTTVYIIRHAEKADEPSADPPLSAAGKARAEQLAHVLGDEGVQAIFVTEFLRSKQTAEPLAMRRHLEPIPYSGDVKMVAQRILTEHIGGKVLVVAHSNTVGDIAGQLGADGITELAESSFDRMFVIHRIGDVVSLERLRYGAPTP